MRICISTYVLLLPEWCVEHVVVHELCHLLEPSHNARFHALMDKYFPRWREARQLTHHYVKHHHQDETNGKADGTEVGVLTAGGFRNELLDYDIEHGASSKGQQVG